MKTWVRLGLIAALAAAVPVMPALAGAKYTAQGFAINAQQPVRVVVVRPMIFVGVLDSQNRQIEDPEWLADTHTNLQAALKRNPAAKALQWRFADWNAPDSKPLSDAVWQPARFINGDLIFKVPQGTMPVKPGEDWQKRLEAIPKGYYEYALPLVALEELRATDPEAQYALLINMHDAFTTDGAKLARLLGGMGNVATTGVNTMELPPHHGFAMMIDLSNGRIVWFYNDGAFGGDLRKPAYADKRVAQMLTGFPLPR
ncbi:MAG: hypothetical protein ACKO1O_09260 [Erythrobacter sp.]